ncbi:hypothetical protein BJV77DRAFT_1067282 [Russula vinacea]|nr:hypothetical protein BJV77DRAFT_1067282 [Russula vinacea]
MPQGITMHPTTLLPLNSFLALEALALPSSVAPGALFPFTSCASFFKLLCIVFLHAIRSNFVLGPGYQGIENGQQPQALPGQPHGSSPVSSNPQAAVASPVSASETTQAAVVASSPLVSIAPSGSQQVPLVEPTQSTLSPPSGSAQISAPASATSSSTPAAAISNSTNSHGAPFWTGIALLCIAGVATSSPCSYGGSAGRVESYKFPEDAISSSGPSESWWQPHGDRDVGEPRRSTSHLLPSSHGTSTGLRELQLPAMVAMSPFTHGPYPTVRPLPLELRLSDTSVPGLMQDVGGSLRVANLVAGDILTSGDESSRPPTALDDVGTPRESSAMFKPRYLSLNGSGLDVPWIQTPPAEPELEPNRPGMLTDPTTPPLNNNNRWKERLERSSAKPAESQDPPSGTIEGWRDSLRNNIASAFGALSSAHPHPPVLA